MTRVVLAGAALAAAAFASPAVACTIDTCPYARPVCDTHAVECYDIAHFTGCLRTGFGRFCIPDPHPIAQ